MLPTGHPDTRLHAPALPRQPIAVVGLGAVLPDAPDVATFWRNVKQGRYSISETPPQRWDPQLYWDPDPAAPDRTYTKIGGWVSDWEWEPLAWRLPIPPKVSDAMDRTQKWAVACARAALLDYGWPERALDGERTAVILGNAMAGDRHYRTATRLFFPELARELEAAESFRRLPETQRRELRAELETRIKARLPEISEDTMPGELANIIAGRVANLFDFHGPNFVCDAACASAIAAISAAVEGLDEGDFDAVLTGGVDANMSASTFIKFCKIGALSATGSRPYGDGADGFVMGEGAALFVLKRLADAERDGDRVYAIIRGLGGSSDGRGKGITAPNPKGQRLAVRRAWEVAGLTPADVGMIEGHGTSTRVGDVVELECLDAVFGDSGLAPGSVSLGSVKSNLGHLKGAAGAAGILKTVLALHERVLPPSLHCDPANPKLDFSRTPFRLQRELEPWPTRNGELRRAGVSAFGFGGTNFHAVLEEYAEGRSGRQRAGRSTVSVTATGVSTATATAAPPAVKPPLRGALVLGGRDEAELAAKLRPLLDTAAAGGVALPAPPAAADLAAPWRLALDHGDAGELTDKGRKVLKALENGHAGMWRALRSQGVHLQAGPPPRTAFLYTGQGSQYAGMLQDLAAREPVVADTFAEADAVMEPLLGRPLTDFVFVDLDDAAAVARAERDLRQTEITQPAVLAADVALTRLLAAYGVAPDMVIGHSLGEYGALVAAGCLPFAEALEAVSARGREMTQVSVADNGRMAAVFAPLEEIETTLAELDGGVVVANVNSRRQGVIGGASDAVERAAEVFRRAGREVRMLPVSHAFHTDIVAPASEALRQVLDRLSLSPPRIPLVANVHGRFYPTGDGAVTEMKELLARQIAAPVRFVRGLETLHEAGARLFVEVGPKRALVGFAEDVLGHLDGTRALYTNHPKVGGVTSFNQALCGLYAAGLGRGVEEVAEAEVDRGLRDAALRTAPQPYGDSPPPADSTAQPPRSPGEPAAGRRHEGRVATTSPPPDRYAELGRLFADFVDRSHAVLHGSAGAAAGATPAITGAGLGLPGTERVFGDAQVGRILRGEGCIDAIPHRHRTAMVERNVVRVVKDAHGNGSFETIGSPADVLKLAARAGALDLAEEFGVPAERVAALDRATQLAIGAGLEALRDAGVPLVQRYRRTTKGTWLPDRWGLPDALRDETGVIFASAFPGYDALTTEVEGFHADRARRLRLAELEELRRRLDGAPADFAAELERRIGELQRRLTEEPYRFDRRFLFRVLSMGHSQFAELIGARGPNTQVNAACASTTQAVSLAEEWIRAGRCRRVVVVSADDITSDALLPWFGAGFLASGAAATDELVADAALPFDRRRHGLIIGMGAAALVVESEDAAAARGLAPITRVLGSLVANSAFHGTRLDVGHICGVMEELVAAAERRWGVDRHAMAPHLMFVSHETYTPARGGSAQAEVDALRQVFGASAERIVVANTKGFTGHPMGTGIEDVVAVKALETGIVPPVANFRDVDPDLGRLNLSRGGLYPVEYALRLGAGFGSQVAMSLLQRVPAGEPRPAPEELGHAYRIVDRQAWDRWLRDVSGQETPELEVVQRTLRLRDRGAPEREALAAQAPAARTPAPTPTPAPAFTGPEPTAPAPEPAAPAPTPPPPRSPEEAAPAAVTKGADQQGLDPVEAKILEIVAAQTGYPPDMLDLDLDMEADLGIDTVKQAETFAAIRQAYDIERDENLQLRDYPTLAHAIQFVYEKRPDLQATTSEPAEEMAATSPETHREETAPAAVPQGAVERHVPPRVPTAVLRPPLDLCKPTGVELGEGTRVVLMTDHGGVGRALAGRLEKRGVEVLTVDDAPAADQLAARLDDFRRAGAVHGLYWLPALDAAGDDGDPTTLDAAARGEALRLRVKLLYTALRALYDDLGTAGAFLVAATRLGGRHGCDAAGAAEPLGGAVTGLVKTFARERPECLVKAVDFPPSRKTAALADVLVDETLVDPGAVEIGRSDDGRRWTVALVDRPQTDGRPVTLGADTTWLVTGAAGGIVSAIVADLAATGGTFHLLDLTPAPDPDDPDLARFTDDRDGLKRDLFERLKTEGERATPALVEKRLAAVERSAAALAAVRAVETAGGTAHWHRVDLTDETAVAAVVERVRATSDRVDVLLHAAGLEISHLLPDKEPAEYDRVFGVKAEGWLHLLAALGGTPLGAAVLFGSIAGRFGNAGQADYAAANDLLAKSASWLRRRRPDTLALTVDWTAWGGIGMATRGSIPSTMAAAGIDVLPPQAGVPYVRRCLQEGRRGEVVAAFGLGVMLDEPDATGGIDPRTLDERATEAGPMIGRVATMSPVRGLTVRTTLDPAAQPFLDDHRIDGTAVLPGVMGIEAFAEAAALPFPDLRATAVEDVAFHLPFKFYRDEPRELEVRVQYEAGEGDEILAHARLVGYRTLPDAPEPRETVHFTGRVRLAPAEREADGAEQHLDTPAESAPAVDAEDIYRIYFHGPAYRVLARAWRDDGVVVGRYTADLPPNHRPEELPTRAEPRWIELAFQTAGLWDLGRNGALGLPQHVDRVTLPVTAPAAGENILVVVKPREGGSFDARLVDADGRVLQELTGYRTVELPGAAGDDILAPLASAMKG